MAAPTAGALNEMAEATGVENTEEIEGGRWARFFVEFGGRSIQSDQTGKEGAAFFWRPFITFS
ncbi:putative uncharacterized protein [Methylocaldum marinum]|uniref:Uncharacterized protein n=1 Tax=Methylocaldum marinum TaxID=1432792 RepID=A0A250KWY5_9GAMM|nr:putative uncharacterized protein [Methylocaldum marinum]